MRNIAILLLFISFPFVGWSQTHPILSYFDGFSQQDRIQLIWATKRGNTCNGIRIFHSSDSLNYDRIGEIPGVCGDAQIEVPYSFVHENPVSGQVNYYKLELGNQGFSTPLRVVFFETDDDKIALFPNPGQSVANILLTGTGSLYEVKVFSSQGVLIASPKGKTGTLLSISAENWPAGTYILQIIQDESILRQRKWIKIGL